MYGGVMVLLQSIVMRKDLLEFNKQDEAVSRAVKSVESAQHPGGDGNWVAEPSPAGWNGLA